MAKGVKKIKHSEGLYYPNMSVIGSKITIKPDQFAWFEIAEWEAGTTAEDKKKPITWMRQSNDRKVIINQMSIPSTNKYGVKLPKNLCGTYHYYIEASLSGKRDFNKKTGIYVKGWCTPKIISSKWSTQRGSKSIKNKNKDQWISYGHIVYLHLKTEGLNGNKLIIELWNQQTAKKDKQIFVYTDVQVIDGEVNLKIQNTYAWMAFVDNIQNVEEFYIKVKDQTSNKYIKDNLGDDLHAIYLNVKNKVATTNVNVPQNQTPTKVGQPDKNKKNTHLCKFEQINIQDNGETFPVFKEGNTLLKKATAETQLATFRVHFDYDKSDIRSDTKDTLKYLLDFLLYNQHLEMRLSGHADDRGSLDYNQALSERRAQAVKDFFANGGLDKNRIKTQGFGEVNPAVAGKTEEAYKKNRRVEIDFSYLEYNQDAIVYETVAGSSDKPRNITVNIINRSDKACFRKEKHKKTEVIVSSLGVAKETKNGNSISYSIYADQTNFPKDYAKLLWKFLNPRSAIHHPFGFHINSCAYYANKNRATLEVRTYPDVVWILNGKYDYEGDYNFHNKSLPLHKGIDQEVLQLIEKFYSITSTNIVQMLANKLLLKYIAEQAQSYSVGLTTIHNRTIEKTGKELSLVGVQTDLITQTQYTKYIVGLFIYEMVCIGIILELAIIYFTRGRSAIPKIQKLIKVAKKVAKTLDSLELEIIAPKIAINIGMYYKKQTDNRMALIYEANLKSDPLIAIAYKKEFDLVEYMGEKNKTKLKNNNTSIKATLTIEGGLTFEENIKYNFLTNTYSFVKKAGNWYNESQAVVAFGQFIMGKVIVEGRIIKELIYFDLKIIRFEGNINFTAKTSFGLVQKYGKDTKGLFVENTVHFSGLKATFTAQAKAILFGTDFIDEVFGNEDEEYIIFPAKNITTNRIYFFKI